MRSQQISRGWKEDEHSRVLQGKEKRFQQERTPQSTQNLDENIWSGLGWRKNIGQKQRVNIQFFPSKTCPSQWPTICPSHRCISLCLVIWAPAFYLQEKNKQQQKLRMFKKIIVPISWGDLELLRWEEGHKIKPSSFRYLDLPQNKVCTWKKLSLLNQISFHIHRDHWETNQHTPQQRKPMLAT